jgi:hypothetical protein
MPRTKKVFRQHVEGNCAEVTPGLTSLGEISGNRPSTLPKLTDQYDPVKQRLSWNLSSRISVGLPIGELRHSPSEKLKARKLWLPHHQPDGNKQLHVGRCWVGVANSINIPSTPQVNHIIIYHSQGYPHPHHRSSTTNFESAEPQPKSPSL